MGARTFGDWSEKPLVDLFEDGETIEATSWAATGLLAKPFIEGVPFMWGSAFWDFAISDRKVLGAGVALDRRRILRTLTFRGTDIVRLRMSSGGWFAGRLFVNVATVECEARFKTSFSVPLVKAARALRPELAQFLYGGRPASWL